MSVSHVPASPAPPHSEAERLALIDRLALHGHLGDAGLDAITETLTAGLRVPLAAVTIVTEDLLTHAAEFGIGAPATRVPDPLSLCAEVVRSGRGLQVADCAGHPVYADNPLVLAGTVRSYAGEPLVYDRHVIGSVSVFDSAPRDFTEGELGILRAQCRLASSVIALRATVDWDGLTGLALRPLLLERMRQATDLRQQVESRNAVLVIDVLGMGSINEALGSHGGDELLKTLAGRLRDTCTPGESPARIGGDEFAVLIQEVRSRTEARLRAEAILAALAAPATGRAAGIPVRWGLAFSPSSSADALLASAERSAARHPRELTRHGDLGSDHATAPAGTEPGLALADESADLALFSVHVDRAVAEAVRTHHLVALAVIHVENVEEVCGGSDPVARELLRQVRGRLTAGVRERDSVMGIGGDRFAVLWRDLGTVDQGGRLAAQLRLAFEEPFPVGSGEVQVSASIGVGILEALPSGDELVEGTVAALSAARDAGPGQLSVFVPPVRVPPEARIRTGAHVLEALQREEFVLHYQPVVDLLTGRVVGVEALVRWQHPVDGLLLPDCFIPVAEATGAIVALGRWVLATACAQAAAWHAQGLALQVAVNLSALEVADPGLLESVAGTLRATGLPPSLLGFEITESVMIWDAERAVVVLNGLVALGASLLIDDFGTGYSSLVYVKRYPVRSLKIDRAFVGGMESNTEDHAIVASVVALARAVNGTCVAEGIETHEQFAALRALGCGYGQGWLFAKAVPAMELPEAAVRCERETARWLEDMPEPGDARDLAGDRRDHAADVRDQAADMRDHDGDVRDKVGDRRDLVGERRDLAGDRRDAAADRRDAAGTRRDLVGDERDEAADRRDQRGASRDRAGDERDQAADQRDTAAQRRDEAALARDRAADARDQVAEQASPAEDGASPVAVARMEAASDRSRASQDRLAGAHERTHAERDRSTALADRGAGARERAEAEQDRGTAQHDRGAGAGERTAAETDRDTALSDRGAGATERAQALDDRETAVTDRSAGADERAHAEQDRGTALADRDTAASDREVAPAGPTADGAGSRTTDRP